MKKCPKCHSFKPNRSFFKNNHAHDGMRSACKDCEISIRKFRSLEDTSTIDGAFALQEKNRIESLRKKLFAEQRKLLVKINEVTSVEFSRLAVISNCTGVSIKGILRINHLIVKYEQVFKTKEKAEEHLDVIYSSPIKIAKKYRNEIVRGEL